MIRFTPADNVWIKPRLEKRFKKAVGFLGTKRDRICSKIIEYGILGVLIFSPLPAASVYEWSILVIEMAVFMMLGAYVLMKYKPILPLGKPWLESEFDTFLLVFSYIWFFR